MIGIDTQHGVEVLQLNADGPIDQQSVLIDATNVIDQHTTTTITG